MADRSAAQGNTFADFLDNLLQVEIEARMLRTREVLLKETLNKSQKLVKYSVDRNHCKGAD